MKILALQMKLRNYFAGHTSYDSENWIKEKKHPTTPFYLKYSILFFDVQFFDKFGLIKEVLCLRWSKHHLRAYFKTLRNQFSMLMSSRQEFLCDTDVAINISEIIPTVTNANIPILNLRQYKSRFL